jgi:hypothetical protein
MTIQSNASMQVSGNGVTIDGGNSLAVSATSVSVN